MFSSSILTVLYCFEASSLVRVMEQLYFCSPIFGFHQHNNVPFESDFKQCLESFCVKLGHSTTVAEESSMNHCLRVEKLPSIFVDTPSFHLNIPDVIPCPLRLSSRHWLVITALPFSLYEHDTYELVAAAYPGKASKSAGKKAPATIIGTSLFI